jgi:two-component system, OmpR family, sensor kinase
MRIGTKLLLTYLALIGLVAVAATLGLPRWVEGSVINAEEARLEKQAQVLADQVANRLRLRATSFGGDITKMRPALGMVEDVLTDEDIAIVGPDGQVLYATLPSMLGKTIPPTYLRPVRERRGLLRHKLPPVAGMGDLGIVVAAPLGQKAPLRDYSLVMTRNITYVQSLVRPISLRLDIVILLVLAASTVVAGWFSRDLVRRLKTTGDAARSVADGHLDSRAPETGNDEITELAGHFNHMADRIQALVDGLRRSEQARKDLLVMVSHELRTPMTSISGFAEALRDGVIQGEEPRQRYYQIIATESSRLNRLIHDLFDVAKLEAGQAELNLQAMPVAPWLLEFAEAFHPAAEAAHAHLELEITPEAERARIYGDRDRLDQVLTNLSSNAARFTPESGPITIRTRVDQGDLVVEVADQGPGLAREETAKVFDRFFQGTSQGRGHKGAGLGLSIVKTLVEAHGGQVGVESAPGQGATFWFRLRVLES